MLVHDAPLGRELHDKAISCDRSRADIRRAVHRREQLRHLDVHEREWRTASPSQSSPPGHHKKKHKPAHVRTQYYRGVGDKNLGTIVVPVDSTLSWTNAKGDNFVITNDFNDDNTIDVNAIGSHDTSQVAAGKYHKVSVIGTNWTMKIVPNK